MLKVLKNLKKSLGAVIIIVILLCVQASTDLALPDYTSKIVNEIFSLHDANAPVEKVKLDISKFNEEDIMILSDFFRKRRY